ncbi:DUF4834 domain-containing protein [Flavobacterium branchiophilum NBRC 15030 = ATCC 35035]|nr:DUF4834 domain-containing protein [Flavobacterium branchiophilum NBRC 15030 = ATCC 35035]
MQTASFNGFIKMVIEIIVFYYAIKFIARLFFPIVVKKVVEKAQQNFQQQYQKTYEQEQDVTKKSKPNQEKTKKQVGEYIDFEEID